jgi:DNA-binding transcriptional ArsR family regulator
MSSLAAVATPAVASGMVVAANPVEVAAHALVGDTARACMLAALMGGQSLTGGELAILARVSPSTASEHLAKLVAARLVAVTKKRRFHYYRIASPLVAKMLESIKAVAAIEVPPRYQPRSARDEALRFARTCYDHIAFDDEVPDDHVEDVALRAPVRGCEFGVVGDKPERDVVEEPCRSLRLTR